MSLFSGRSIPIDRRKALLGSGLNGGPATIDEAYKELSRDALAVWLRMCTLSRAELRAGSRALSEILQLTPSVFNRVSNELRRLGYMQPVKKRGYHTTYVILRKLLIQSELPGVIRL
jgi:hypothetical protein